MPVITVSQLNNYMKRYIERNEHLSDLWIKAEISNFKKHYSGHIYMTLKDELSSIKAVMFKSYADNLKFIPQNGSMVIAFGKIGVYERDGAYQLYIESIIPDGIGELYAAYERLKEQLQNEGLFMPEHKKPIPKFPKCIGIVTSITGAALRDIMNVISRRYLLCDICIYPAKVQGIGASDSICDGLDYFLKHNECDVVILARGGGSIEDLWAFNEEKTARAIYACSKPVISGVGHETDYTISDFVSDLRAPTPSAAAEIATPSQHVLKDTIYDYKKRISFLEMNLLSKTTESLNMYTKSNLSAYINKIIESKLDKCQNLKIRMANSFTQLSTDIIKKLSSLSATLDALNPTGVLKRGYSFLTDFNNKLIDTSLISKGDNIKIIFDKGYAKCDVLEVEHEK